MPQQITTRARGLRGIHKIRATSTAHGAKHRPRIRDIRILDIGGRGVADIGYWTAHRARGLDIGYWAPAHDQLCTMRGSTEGWLVNLD